MGKTGQQLASYAISKIGTPYFYGSKMKTLTGEYMELMHEMYPRAVTEEYMSRAREKGQVGKVNVDCSGLPGAYRGKQIGSYQLYSTAYTRLPISQIAHFAKGTILWKSGHVGVYIGNGYCVEAKGLNYGTVRTKASDTKWKYGLTFRDIDYAYRTNLSGQAKWKGANPYTEPTKTVTTTAQAKKKGISIFVTTGEDVKWVQWELVEAGFSLVIDGICGPKTLAAILAFQRSCKITADGLAGKNTRACLKAN